MNGYAWKGFFECQIINTKSYRVETLRFVSLGHFFKKRTIRVFEKPG